MTASVPAPIGATDTLPAHDVTDLGREISRLEDLGPHRIFEVVADVRDAVRPRHDLALWGLRRRSRPRVIANTVQRFGTQIE